ncbi:MAG: 6-carboxytetrahydropterin synthase QueD [Deltaproteobacteria bacterium]|nr:6-carboxytetrahydropterin synthase QueD [Deltaproteobacteria bacterium]MBW1814250.1 6-carboxytetrahydropterin synthase QueD [Deltaproteobacteria bacterium]MBW1847065.1 6-carboxytetrahydropterin synthase QueD [Deltaproteobacteria bacterium]MBW2181643.1 6-carboxytetrahydropterin synthase QueD [Deltaproteobacteria bacterium]MBW2365036.1 6-carboxytetrahydropterin synthase QueD [Deltaproteobacteria bacterium]
MFELKVTSHFSAAHQLKMVAKKCENLHGHNWKVEVDITGEKLNHAGVLIDFGEIKMHISKIMEKLDHKFLNDLECFHDGNPSSENIAKYISEELQAAINDSSVQVSRVTAWESDDACASYIT